ncbi:MAG: hypothetical protein ACRDNK_11130 [Solirubrobacteraceae bacterium]
MAITEFARAWRDEVDERIVADPDRAAQLLQQIQRLNSRASVSALDDVVSQPWSRRRRDWYDAAAIVEVAEQLQIGFWAIASVPLGAEPGKDRDELANQTKLDKLKTPYSAWCATGVGDDDGGLEWDAPIRIRHVMHEEEPLVLEYPASGVPLEIGHTEPETTIFHLRRDGGVARWPYRDQNVTLLLSTGVTDRSVQLSAPSILQGAEVLRQRALTLAELRGPDDQ